MSIIRNILKNSRSDKDGNFFLQLQQILGYKPKKKIYLPKGIYPSFYEYQGQKRESNQLRTFGVCR